MERHMITVKEVAAYLGVHTDTVYCMVKLHEIPHLRIGNRILFTKGSINRWIQDQTNASLHS